jgi:hypothetical protein
MMIIKKSMMSKATMMIVLVAAICLPFHAYTEAKANPVGIQAPSTGGMPLLSFSGIHNSNTQIIYTVPADRVFVLTGAVSRSGSDYTYFSIYENSVEKISQWLITNVSHGPWPTTCHALCSNQARIPFSSGSQIKLQASSTGNYYLIQGYLANPN